MASAGMRIASATLPGALLDPLAYPHRPDRVELHETHISWVFVAGDDVYKVKKPVTFGFLDYGSRSRRRAFCHAELALGRRFAPALYRGVAALVPRGPDGLRIALEHDPRAVDYAVVMVRYDDADTLAARLADRAVGVDEIAAVGAALAEWHADSPECPGAPIEGVVTETLDALAGAGVPERRVAALRHFCDAALRAYGPTLAERARRGLVRDGHGDLRAEHILMTDRIVAVDALEFDPDLRRTDVGYDLAFLVMDVARHDDDLARALVRGYRAAGGDPGPDGLLTFFCALRALVRAKVDLLRAGQLSGAAEQERSRRGEELLALAERYAWRARLPRLLCVAGFAASGKSTLAENIAAASGRQVISSDRIRKLRAGVDPFERAPASAYGEVESRAVYAELGQRASAVVREEGGAVVDATFRRGSDTDAFEAAASARPEWIVCEAPPEVLLERARARASGASVSDAGPNIVATELAVHRGRILTPRPALARLDTTRPLPELLAELALVLDERLTEAS